jgi:hypothetical protein
VPHADGDHHLVDRIREPAKKPLRQRDSGEHPLGPFTEARVDLRDHPDRGALVDGEVGGPLGELGNQLHGRRTGSDHRDAASRGVEVVLPLGGVDDLALEVRDAGDVGDGRLRQEARRGDQVTRGEGFTAGQGDPPDARILVPACALDRGVEAHVLADVILVGDVVGVLLDLGARGEQARPVRVGLEEVRVRRGRHVDGQAGVVIDVPRAAQVVLAVEDDEVVKAIPLELDRCADSCEPGSHDDRVESLRSHS